MTNEKLKAARESRGWTKTQVATFLEVGEGTYAAWEEGKTTPSEKNRNKLCHLLRKSREELGL